MSKSNTFFDEVIADVVRSGLVEKSLYSVYRPCKRLISFSDFCQETVLQAIKYKETFRGTSKAELVGWLMAIGRQRMINILRKQHPGEIKILPDEIMDSSVVEAESVELALREQKLAWLNIALQTLGAVDREILEQRYRFGKRWTDISRDLGIPPNTLAQRHLRLIGRLRAMRKREDFSR